MPPTVSPALISWVDAVLGAAPLELDRAAGALLRYCRDHAPALREARSGQLDRFLAPSLAVLSGWLAEQVTGDLILPNRLALGLSSAWRDAHARASAAAAAAAIARLAAEALDDGLGHRFVQLFRRRAEWRLAPGDPFPVVQPDLKTLFATGAGTPPLLTLPDRREAPIDRTRRLAVAPAADGIDLALDLSQAVMAAPPPSDAKIAAALPIASPTRELDWSEGRGPRKVFHDVRPRASADVASRAERLLDDACARGASIVVFPELAIDEAALARLRDRLARAASPPALIVAGSRHVRGGASLRNVATMLTAGGGEAHHAKFNPYFAGEQLEDISLVPAEVRAHGLVDDTGRLVFSVAVLICKDFLAPGAQRALEALRPTLVLVPAWSQKTAIFESDAIGLTGKTQSTVAIVNQADPPGPGGEDPAAVILTRPSPALGPVLIRRSEIQPPTVVVVSLAQ